MASKKAAPAAVFNRARPSGTASSSSRGLPMPVMAAPPSPKRAPTADANVRAALRALVPSSYNPEGEADPYLRAYKTKWLSKLDFTSDINVQSLLTLSFLVLAIGRQTEAEVIADQIIKHVDLHRMSSATRAAVGGAMYLSAYLKTKRGEPMTSNRVISLQTRAKLLGKYGVEKNREWLSDDAMNDINDALARKRVDELVQPFVGIVRWLNESGARTKAEQLFTQALDATRTLMRST